MIELPFAPTNVQAVRLDNRLINVSWAPGFDGNSEVLKYIVQRREVSDLGELQVHCVISHSAIVVKLTPRDLEPPTNRSQPFFNDCIEFVLPLNLVLRTHYIIAVTMCLVPLCEQHYTGLQNEN